MGCIYQLAPGVPLVKSALPFFQSVYELVHSEDREELQRQLGWNSFIGQEDAGVTLQVAMTGHYWGLHSSAVNTSILCAV